MVNRRRFLAWGGSTAMMGSMARAQTPSRVVRIGFLSGAGELSETRSNLAALEKALGELGYGPGSIRWEKRFAEGRYDRLGLLAEELVALRPDIILLAGGTATDVARKAIKGIPMVMVLSADPVASGFVSNLARPGGTLTGVTSTSAETGAKRIELLLDLAPKLRRIVYVYNPANPTYSDAGFGRVAEPFKRERNIDIDKIGARTPEQIDEAFRKIRQGGFDAVVVPADSFLAQQHEQIAALSLAARLPSVGALLSYAKSGGLAAYGANYDELYRQAASYIDKIARGAKPGDLAVARADVVEAWVNQRTADSLGLRIPQTVMLRIANVIQ
jgi:putative ABC transport system substrate-binding protein